MASRTKQNLQLCMKSMNDVLPVELIHAILLRVPARYLFRLKLVSKLWLSLISHPNFVELHLHHSSALTPTAFFLAKNSNKLAHLVDLHALFDGDGDGDAIKEVSIPFVKNKEQLDSIQFLRSCGGFVLLHREPHFILWNPVTGYRKQVSHLCDLNNKGVCELLAAILKFYNRIQIWMMQDYKVHSSWTLYDIGHKYMDPCYSKPLGLFNGSDFIMLNTNHKISKYSVEGELLQHVQYYRHGNRRSYYSFTLYTESLATLPCDKKKWAKIRSRWREFFRRIFSKRIRGNPTYY
ncbi:hypothetical protein PIB30_063943 [Stylosanthes scabra]|uniref:F-box domain-containing protein n=1 Tax=Stylosanthes scabra TaxID=79078 RepID=A0ABU6SMV8_9FABA|nr:hypothetical protein [Stylosanthes scabra]